MLNNLFVAQTIVVVVVGLVIVMVVAAERGAVQSLSLVVAVVVAVTALVAAAPIVMVVVAIPSVAVLKNSTLQCLWCIDDLKQNPKDTNRQEPTNTKNMQGKV